MSVAKSFGESITIGDAAEMRLPESLPDPGLLVGWSMELEHRRQPVGFTFGEPDKTPATGWLDPVLLNGEGHLVTIAPTGSGKGRSCIIPALLRHDGPVIVIDPKGENAAVTARHRRAMGQQVVVLDPIGISGEPSGSLNPLDLIDPASADAVDLAGMFANAMIDANRDPENTYWYQRAQQLLIGLILHVSALPEPGAKTFATIRQLLAGLVAEQGNQNTPIRDTIMVSPHPEARLAGSILQSSAAEGLGSILSMTQHGVDFLRGTQVENATGSSSFDLQAVTRGDPFTLYLVLPPHMLESHGQVLRLWIMALMSLITRRRGRPKKSTLFILDEAAQLGTLPQLRQAITLLRGYGVQVWSFWQDVSQIRRLYPADWETMVNNCSVVQAFGALNLLAAQSMESLTGFGGGDGRAALELDDHEILLQIAGDEAVVARKPDYLSDPAFAGQFDPNPFHDPDREIMPPPPPRIRLDARQPSEQPASTDEGKELANAVARRRRDLGERLREGLLAAARE